MTFVKKTWKNRVSEFFNRYRLENLNTGQTTRVTLDLDDGIVAEAGDTIDAATMNDLEQRIADGFDGIVIPDVPEISVGWIGTASATTVRQQRIVVDETHYAIAGTRYMEQTKTLSTSADTTFTFTHEYITTSSDIEPHSSIFGLVPSSITVSAGSCSVVVPKQSSAVSCTVRIYIK